MPFAFRPPSATRSRRLLPIIATLHDCAKARQNERISARRSPSRSVMTEYIDDKDTPNNDNGVAGGPPEAGWPYAVKPAWIAMLLDLWERDKLVTLLLELATDRVAQDIANPTTRRRTLLQIARYFVPHAGVGGCGAPCRPTCGQPTASFFGAGLGPGLPGANRRSHNMARRHLPAARSLRAGRLRRAKRGAQPSFRALRQPPRRARQPAPCCAPGAFRRAGLRRASATTVARAGCPSPSKPSRCSSGLGCRRRRLARTQASSIRQRLPPTRC